MYFPDAQPDEIENTLLQIQELTESVLDGLDPYHDPIAINSTSDLYEGEKSPGTIFKIVEGTLHSSYQKRLLYFHETGDLIGIQNALRLPAAHLSSETPCTLAPYKISDIFTHITNDTEKLQQWSRLVAAYGSIFMTALARFSNKTDRPTPGFLHFRAGDIIIQEGTKADCVYTIMDGEAEVSKGGVTVGDIGKEDIFGAMAVFTNTERTATVTAKTPCSVIAVPKNQFIDLIEYQPRMCLALIENLAETINSLNEKVLSLQGDK